MTSARSECVNSAININPSLATKRESVGVSCGCLLEDASKRWPYDDYLKNQYSYGQQQMNDGTVKRCLELAGLISNQDAGSGGGTASPVAVISGKPLDPSRDAQLNIQVSGSGIEKYRFKVGLTSLTDCSQSAGYSTERLSTTPITNSLATMLNNIIRICVVGKVGSVWQSYDSATEYEWFNDNSAPTTPGTPNFTILSGNNIGVSWSPSLYGEPVGYLIIRRSGTSASTVPDSGVNYSVGDSTSGGSVVVYKGVGTSFTDTTAVPGNVYSYSGFSYDELFNFSSAATAVFLFRSWHSQTQLSNLIAPSGFDGDIDSNGGITVVTADKSISYSSSTGWSAPIDSSLGSSPKFKFSSNGVGFGFGSSGAAIYRVENGWSEGVPVAISAGGVGYNDPAAYNTWNSSRYNTANSCGVAGMAVNRSNNAVFISNCQRTWSISYRTCSNCSSNNRTEYTNEMFGRAYIDGSWSAALGFSAGSGSVISLAMAPDNMTRLLYSTGSTSAPNLKYFDMDPSGQSLATALQGDLYPSSSNNIFSGVVLSGSSLGFQTVFGVSSWGSSTDFTRSLFTDSPFGQLSVSDSADNFFTWGTRPLAYIDAVNRFYFVSVEPDVNSKTKVVLRSTVAGSGIWSSERVFGARVNASRPSISVSGSGHLALAWLEGSSDQDVLSAVYYPDFGWVGPKLIDLYNESARGPIPLVSNSGEVSVIWSQFTSSMVFQAQFK